MIYFCLFVSVKPQSVNILTQEKFVSADKRYEVECRTAGSRPEAIITWWKGSRHLKKLTKNVSKMQNYLCDIFLYSTTLLKMNTHYTYT